MKKQLALYGGEKVKQQPYGTGRRFGEEELTQLKEALDQNTLFYWSGTKVKTLCAKFAKMYGAEHCVAASSGTAAIHVALGALGVTEGDEVITSPITDMGSIIGIMYQNAIPVFADLDPHTYNMDPKSIEKCITEKTKAIVVVHLAGNPAEMDEIMAIARKHNIFVVEDCAQSFMCRYKGRLAGTIGDMGCFSLNDFKHISAGDGGLVLVKNPDLYVKTFMFADKNYNRFSKGAALRVIEFLAPNYRMNELTAAVGIAQLDKLEKICATRKRYGEMITEGIKHLKGVYPHEVKKGNQSSFWFYMFRIDPKVVGTDTTTFAEALKAEGIGCQRGYIPSVVYLYDMFQNKEGYPGTHAPFDSKYYGKDISYPKGLCPVAEEILDTAIRLNLNEFYTEQDIQDIIDSIVKVTEYFKKG
ncbi:MAG TPA: DegT/DnrJ/EryC1/StrS family aminotransferase [Clostridia bacterium]|jgi:dTDP-4-amino-4,6-dideoxygalactose transaminase|nr:DegT/DnrJ/EryC1/StrS family aminotransferase [Clostridia bacterium]HPY97575.1 DegT/DnrJ/EryC1/StrS family aminotransferase [Clostridia bacterium]HQC67805.1 DegT/DnrJ/EryC1/StrS family aminotransferase [Clostridia bacterium]